MVKSVKLLSEYKVELENYGNLVIHSGKIKKKKKID